MNSIDVIIQGLQYQIVSEYHAKGYYTATIYPMARGAGEPWRRWSNRFPSRQRAIAAAVEILLDRLEGYPPVAPS